MNEKTREDIALAFVAGTATFIITFLTLHYSSAIKNMVK